MSGTDQAPCRRLVADDAVAYRRLRLAALRESPASFGSAYEDEEPITPASWAAFIAGSEERVFFGALAGAGLVASVGLEREAGRKERHRAFVRSMYVQPERRGLGLSRRLLGLALDCAAGWVGVEQITLAVTTSNAAAQALYRSVGFVEYGVAPRALCVAGSYHDESLLVKHLGAA